MDSRKYEELLARYLKGDCTDEERALLEQWFDSLDTEVPLPATGEEKKRLLAKNWETLATRTTGPVPAHRPIMNWYGTVAAAALVVLAVSLGWYLLRKPTSVLVAYTKRIPSGQSSVVERVNTSTRPLRLVLGDSSVVTLQPGSFLRYAAAFAQDKREVTLVGDAFFEVEKDPNRPFLVYANDLVTKVLGTSFYVHASASGKNVTVTVRTGKVSVYSPKLVTTAKTNADPETIGVVLTPNQQVTYLGEELRFVKTLVQKPAILTPPGEQTAFTFQNAPVSQIFAALETMYGVDVVYDEELMRNCFITTSLESEDVYDNLSILCKLLGASYKVIDAQIVITSTGCPQ
ncbi:hypothetical protein GCM10023187_02880 [Nibrella viscosa]|uniref:FecR family protein n=1 Tax=Nibrella viscosa TaxID=1084524 RepID=A0ABP8JTX6_9BACT